MSTCKFGESEWNDYEQRNYILYTCKNPDNTGGRESTHEDGVNDYHGMRTYSCWHPNNGMIHRCFDESKKIDNCPLINKSE